MTESEKLIALYAAVLLLVIACAGIAIASQERELEQCKPQLERILK